MPLNPDYILSRVLDVWEHREDISREMEPVVAEEKRKASSSAELLRPYLA